MSTDKERELEQAKKKWDQYFKDNAGKISSEFPKTMFDNELNKKSDAGTNEIKKLYKLLRDSDKKR